MKLIKRWETELPNPFGVGVIEPGIDPITKSALYIADGAGSSFASMKFRKLSLENGKEIASVKINNTVRCWHLNSKTKEILAVSDNKIFIIDHETFRPKDKLTNSIPRYMDYIESDANNNLIMMNWRGKSLSIYNMEQEKVINKRLKWCRGIFKESDTSFLISSPLSEGIFRYNRAKDSLMKVLDTGVFSSVSISKSKTIFIQAGEYIPEKKQEHSATSDHINALSDIAVYQSVEDNNPIILTPEIEYKKIHLSSDTTFIYLTNNNILYKYSVNNDEVIDTYEFEKGMTIFSISTEENKVFTFKPSDEKVLHCWDLK